IPAPTGAETARLEWLEQRLRERPGERHRDGAGNLVWRFGPGVPELLIMAHVDTVFAAGTPLPMTHDGGDLVGPGVGDNATAVMTLVWTLEAMPAIPASLAVAFTVGEEGLGNLRGALHACRELRPAAAIALEGQGLDEVITEHVGSLRARLAVTGPGGHSWSDRGTPSALHALVKIADRLAGEGANVGKLSGGEAVNAIAARAEMIVERRSLEQAELDAFEARLRAVSVAPPLALACDVVGRRPAGQIDPEHPLVSAILAVRRGLGLADAFGAGSTDANAAAAVGIPAVSRGCARGSGMHTLRERIDLSSLEVGSEQLRRVIEGALPLPSTPGR
ncbi:MAG TPA: M20/M25/M40 family metallo-hydrolase, partial [Solirubrobacteraceae bacterium]|nr:M20/M25/M40 family metallo-hydrolase [Solirubrobacteraceae bacterium]